MEDNMMSSVILGALGVLLVCTVVLIPVAMLVFHYAYGKEAHESFHKEQQAARERLIAGGVVPADRWC